MSTVQTTKATGGCLCGEVKYEVSGQLREVNYCHCEQCRKTSGHFVAATACDLESLAIISDASLRWYQSSSTAARGFCANCGASVFWRPEHGRYICIMAGTLDAPTGLTAKQHIFLADASDYYTINDGLPQHADYGPLGRQE
jgi:hypothetical protein